MVNVREAAQEYLDDKRTKSSLWDMLCEVAWEDKGNELSNDLFLLFCEEKDYPSESMWIGELKRILEKQNE